MVEPFISHARYMSRCLQLARKGAGFVAPNPMVGAIIVHKGDIIGEGYHRHFGGAHAEPNAINSVKDKSLLQESTLYVSLEPCSHYGKTPPCADLIISYGIPRVIIGMLDPNPQVAGRGIRKLKEAGVEVTTGIMEQDCRELNKHFLCFHEQHRPYISLKWAQTADGFIDNKRESAQEQPLCISNDLTRIVTHKERTEHQAILVGANTAVLDDPTLTVRHWSGPNPIRIVIDPNGKTSRNIHLFDGSVPTIIYTGQMQHEKEGENTSCITLDFNNPNVLWHILQNMYERGINSVLVEGGAYTLNEFIRHGLWDEARVEVSPLLITDGVKAPAMTCLPVKAQDFQGHRCFFYRNNDNLYMP